MKILQHLTRAALFVLLIGLVPTFSFAQKTTNETKSTEQKPTQLVARLATSVKRIADSTLNTDRRYSDSLVSAITIIAARSSKQIDFLADSLVASARDSLDAPQKEKVRFAANSLRQRLLAFAETAKKSVGAPFSRLVNALTLGKKTYSTCDGCESGSDVDDRLEEFRDYVSNLRESFHDTTETLMEDQKDRLQEGYEAAHDSLITLREHLIEQRLGEIDYHRYEATRFTVSTSYSSRSSYRGRDNGVPQQMIAPAIAFFHSSGFSVEVSTYWLDETPQWWDDVAASVSYEFAAGGLFGGAVSYSHFWFSDSSRSSQAVFTNSFAASVSLNWPVLLLSIRGDLATGEASEFTLTASASHPFELPLTLHNKLTIEPTLSATIGEQNSTLTTIRTKGAGKGKKVTTVSTEATNTFGILAYEASLPVIIMLGPVTLSPALKYVKPMNVIDESTRKAFIDFEFGISLTIR